MSQDDREDDIEDSLITQFETTLSIRPSNDIHEADDITVDQSSVFQGASLIKTEQIHLVQNGLGLDLPWLCQAQANHQDKLSNPSSSELRKSEDLNYTRKKREIVDRFPELKGILEPSKGIDLELSRFKKTFAEFMSANPLIQSQSPRFAGEADKTLVLLSPFLAEHAFGRSWVLKSYLSTIFERPQRLLASCIGISAALSMYPFYYKIKNSTRRGSIFAKHVTNVHGKAWPETLLDLCLKSHEKLTRGELEVPPEWNPGDIYLTPKSLTALEGAIGTIETAVEAVFDASKSNEAYKLAFVVLRPPGHHCHASLPSGFCVLNNAQIAVEYAYQKYGVSHCAIFDIDLHHGDGTQDICWERAGFRGDYGKDDMEDEYDVNGEIKGDKTRNEHGKRSPTYPKVGYFSLHDIKSYPTEIGFASKENIKNASTCIMDHDISIWNVHLQEWTSEEEFFKQYQTKYVALLNRANQFFNQAKKQHDMNYLAFQEKLLRYNKFVQKPHLFKHPIKKPTPPPSFKPLIIMSTGLDASEYENSQMQRHGINVPTSFYAKFSKDVVKLAQIHTDGKVISFLEGGYSDGALISGIFSHLIGLTNKQKGATDDPVLWNETWGTEQVVRELTKGCKRVWLPYKNPRTEITIWAKEVIKLGRLLMPQSILPVNQTYLPPFQRPTEVLEPNNKMLREIYDEKNSPGMTNDHHGNESERRILRNLRHSAKRDQPQEYSQT